MFKAQKETSSLRILNQKAEAKLSDMFMLLYFLYLAALNERTIPKISIYKFFTYLLDDLEKNNKLQNHHYFNTPLYKWKYGTYNYLIEEKHLDKLKDCELVNQNGLNYSIDEKGVKLIEEFINDTAKDDKIKYFEDKFQDFAEKYLKKFDLEKVINYAHGIKIKIDDNVKKIHNLENDESIAIVYNSTDFKNGKKADIVPFKFLTKLSYLLQESEDPIPSTQGERIVNQILGCKK